MNKVSKACDISPAVRREVLARDGERCIICGATRRLQIAHYISRGRLGLGIPQNLAVLCLHCHFHYDNGKDHGLYKSAFKAYLMRQYADWDEHKLTYKKGG